MKKLEEVKMLKRQRPIAIRLPEQVIKELDEVSKKEGLTRSEIMKALLLEFLEKYKKGEIQY